MSDIPLSLEQLYLWYDKAMEKMSRDPELRRLSMVERERRFRNMVVRKYGVSDDVVYEALRRARALPSMRMPTAKTHPGPFAVMGDMEVAALFLETMRHPATSILNERDREAFAIERVSIMSGMGIDEVKGALDRSLELLEDPMSMNEDEDAPAEEQIPSIFVYKHPLFLRELRKLERGDSRDKQVAKDIIAKLKIFERARAEGKASPDESSVYSRVSGIRKLSFRNAGNSVRVYFVPVKGGLALIGIIPNKRRDDLTAGEVEWISDRAGAVKKEIR